MRSKMTKKTKLITVEPYFLVEFKSFFVGVTRIVLYFILPNYELIIYWV